MAIQFKPIEQERSVLPGQPTQVGLSQLDESYFEKLAAFGLACLAAAVVGKLTLAVLTPKHEDIRPGRATGQNKII